MEGAQCDRSSGASPGNPKRMCSSGSIDDIERAPSGCRGSGRMICVGDRCFPIRECAKVITTTELCGSGAVACAGGAASVPETLCESSTNSGNGEGRGGAGGDNVAERVRWLPFGPSVKPLFKQGFVWVLAAPPCASKHIIGPMGDFFALFEEPDERSEPQGVNGAIEDAADASGEQLKRAAKYPRIRFQTCDEIKLCEKAISVYGRAPFCALVHLPTSKAYVLDIVEMGECSARCAYDPSRRCAAFRPVTPAQVSDFIRQAVTGSWPKARMGECAPPFDIDESLDATCTLTAVLHTVPRLVRGTVTLFSQARLMEDAEASSGPCLRQVAAGPAGSGPLLVVFTLWAPRCPCCPSVIKVLDCIIHQLNSTTFRENYPSCPLLNMNATIRHVVCDVDKNELPDSEWPHSPADGLNVDTPSPSQRPSPTSTCVPAEFLGSLPTTTLPPSSSSGSGSAHRTEAAEVVPKSLPCIMTYRDGIQVAHFLGVRTPKNLVRYVVRSFGVAPHRCMNQDEDLTCGWFYSLVAEAERADEDSTSAMMKKRGRSDPRL